MSVRSRPDTQVVLVLERVPIRGYIGYQVCVSQSKVKVNAKAGQGQLCINLDQCCSLPLLLPLLLLLLLLLLHAYVGYLDCRCTLGQIP